MLEFPLITVLLIISCMIVLPESWDSTTSSSRRQTTLALNANEEMLLKLLDGKASTGSSAALMDSTFMPAEFGALTKKIPQNMAVNTISLVSNYQMIQRSPKSSPQELQRFKQQIISRVPPEAVSMCNASCKAHVKHYLGVK